MTAHMPKVRITSDMNNNCESSRAVVSKVTDEMTNCVRSHIEFIRYPFSFILLVVSPGDHKSTCMIQNGTVTGHEKYSSLFLLLQILYT